ncbi:hypothetical protein DFH07DRAFT_760221 [Mycena maculata]|uniref:Required for respiratory growth protein 7, mitochondrial n=1 Tax=Mycena maculata TaxID=230809 RepID=A0AAD7ML98_9AGAR|nr:hypothetical protein DFH07DRAFT_760221 [Mycena maculata]
MAARRFLSAVSPILATVHRGNNFEERSMKILQDHLSMSLRRVGGKSDGGIDLMGWWWLPPAESEPQNVPDALPPRRRLRVLAQCKAEKKKAGPHYVREMEGVLHRYMSLTGSASSASSQYPLVALLVSESSFTKSTILRAQSSPVPFFLLHIPPLPDPDATEDVDEEPSKIGTAVWNPALAGTRGLLQGKMEARWERSLTGAGRPGVWWNGQRLRSWTPDGDSEEELTMENEDRFFEALAEGTS